MQLGAWTASGLRIQNLETKYKSPLLNGESEQGTRLVSNVCATAAEGGGGPRISTPKGARYRTGRIRRFFSAQ